MKNTLLASVILVSLFFVGCKSSQDTTKKSENKSSEAKANSYRLIVSFISKGTGFDAAKKNAFLSYVESHPKKPTFKSVQWGKEGEIDYCFTLSELSEKEQKDFVKELKSKMAGSDLVVILENTVCKNVAR